MLLATPPATEPPPPKSKPRRPQPSATAPILDLRTTWSRAARQSLMQATPQIKAIQVTKTAQTAIAATLQMAPPRYRALKTRLATLDSPLFSLDFSLVDDAKIQSVNRQFRGLDKPTDVLSFAQFEDVDAFPVDFPAEGEEIALGDVMISVETAARQASELGHSPEREIAFLCIHGTLHLLGYDHTNGSDRRAMWKWQDAVFAVWEEGGGKWGGKPTLPPPPSLLPPQNLC